VSVSTTACGQAALMEITPTMMTIIWGMSWFTSVLLATTKAEKFLQKKSSYAWLLATRLIFGVEDQLSYYPGVTDGGSAHSPFQQRTRIQRSRYSPFSFRIRFKPHCITHSMGSIILSQQRFTGLGMRAWITWTPSSHLIPPNISSIDRVNTTHYDRNFLACRTSTSPTGLVLKAHAFSYSSSIRFVGPQRP
jgi:hypothetical protein